MRPSAVLLVTTIVLAGCGGGAQVEVGGSIAVHTGEVYGCGPATFTATELADAPPATELGADGRAALAGAEVGEVDPADAWVVLTETDEELALVRELATPEPNGPGDVRTHEFLHVQRITGATNVPDGSWMLDAAGTCTPRLELDGLDAAELTLLAAPEPGATTIELGVTERACASGQPATGRVEVVRQTLTDDELQLVVGVRPQSGAQDCQSNPPTPVTLTLDGPLGDRTIVDAATLPPQPVPVAPAPADDHDLDAAVEAILSYAPPASYVMAVARSPTAARSSSASTPSRTPSMTR